MLVSGAVIYNRVAGMTDARPRHEIPPPVLYMFAPTIAQASSQLDASSYPAPPRHDDFINSPPGTSYSP